MFKAKYNEATDNISQIYFVADKHLDTPVASKDAVSSGNEPTLMGFFFLVETKLVQKDTPKVTKSGEQHVSVSRTKHLRKLHLV